MLDEGFDRVFWWIERMQAILKPLYHKDIVGGPIFHITMIRMEFKEDFVVSCKLGDTEQVLVI